MDTGKVCLSAVAFTLESGSVVPGTFVLLRGDQVYNSGQNCCIPGFYVIPVHGVGVFYFFL